MNSISAVCTPYIEMFIWFIVLYAFGAFSTSLAPLFSILVITSPLIDKGMVFLLRQCKSKLYEQAQ